MLLQTKLALVLSSLMLVAILSTGYSLYQMNSELILRSLQGQLLIAANTLSLSIDGDKYQRLQGKESIGSPEYNELREVLWKFYQANKSLGVEQDGVYTYKRTSKDSLMFTIMLHDQYVGNMYPLRREMLPTFDRGVSGFTGIYEDDYGVWVSAYAPIRDSQQKVVGIVEVDFRNSRYVAAVMEELYATLLYALIGVVVGTIVAIIVSRLITRPIIAVSQAASAFTRGELNQKVVVSSKDEIGTLGIAFNAMVRGVREKEIYRVKAEELQRAYRNLEVLNKSLEEANRLKSEFLAIAAHDLKNPLAVILNAASLIEMVAAGEPRTKTHAGMVVREADRMLSLISELLTAAEIEDGRIALKKEFFDLGEIAQRVVATNTPQAEKKNQQLVFIWNDPCPVEVDEGKFYQVIENLVSNAIKYSRPGKTIRARVYKTENKACFEVQDEGPGLTDDDKQKMFRKFARLSATPTGGESSSGIGLSVVKQLVELHDGSISAESEGVGRGSIFRVIVPSVATG